jgi:signal transduction histidine kinase
MNEEDLKRIFDPYFVAKKSGLTDTKKGSGLGANLIFNRVTSSLKGELSVSSPVNSGLQYNITFPSFLR